MLWLKAFHLIFVVTWFAGLFYLPRLFVYHAEAIEPVVRERSGEELAVQVLQAYRRQGMDAALALRRRLPGADKRLLLMHALVAAMQGHPGDAWQLQRLARG